MLTRLLSVAHGGGAVPLPHVSDGLINAAPTSAYVYAIGPISSTDNGLTWSAGSGAVISAGSGWESAHVKDPCLIWDGSQYVCFYSGFNGSVYQIGRATASSVSGTWTKYGSNPVIGTGAGGSPDEAGAMFPTVLYDPSLSPAWMMWYGGFPSGSSAGSPSGVRVCFADSSDGITWTKHGAVLTAGTSGDFDDSGCLPGAVIRDGPGFTLHYAGFRASTNFFHSGVATCTSATGSYTRLGVLSGFSGNLTLGGFAFRSNQVRTLAWSGGQLIVGGTAWNASGHPEEGGWATTATSPTSVTAPTGLIVPLGSGWDANSAENPTFVSR